MGSKITTLTFSGKIDFVQIDGNYFDVTLEQPDGYLVDLTGRLKEAVFNYGKKVKSCRYFISDAPINSMDDAQEMFVKHLYGSMGIEYSATYIKYSEYTSDMEYEQDLTIGGHSLFDELYSRRYKDYEQVDVYLMMEITFEYED